MKKVLLSAVIVLGIMAAVFIVDSKSKPTTSQSTTSTPISTPQSTTTDEIMVFICTSANAYAYHIESTCEYLNKCGCEIKEIHVEQAQRMNRKPCKACTMR